MPVESLVGFCLTCNIAHTESETFILRGLLRCKQTHALVDRFSSPVPMEQNVLPTREAIRTGILDMAFHAGINLEKNKVALDEIAQRFYALAESEQGK
jgi:hypothetical protein